MQCLPFFVIIIPPLSDYQYFCDSSYNQLFKITVPTRPPVEDQEKEETLNSESADLMEKVKKDSSVKSENKPNSNILLKNAYVKVERLLSVSLSQASDEPESECQRVDKIRDVSKKKTKTHLVPDEPELESQEVNKGRDVPKKKSKTSLVSGEPVLECQRVDNVKDVSKKKTKTDLVPDEPELECQEVNKSRMCLKRKVKLFYFQMNQN